MKGVKNVVKEYEPIYTVKEVAKILRTNPQAVYRLTGDTLTNITNGGAMALTREQSAALSALLAPEAADNP